MRTNTTKIAIPLIRSGNVEKYSLSNPNQVNIFTPTTLHYNKEKVK